MALPSSGGHGMLGRFQVIRRDAITEIGHAQAYVHPGFAALSARLKGIGVFAFRPTRTNGPTLHETAHYWAVFLDMSFGFGRSATALYDTHWGLAGVRGQLGGFDPTTLRCDDPPSAVPPHCTDAGSSYRVSTSSFSPTANGGDTLPYAPIELYLMGLLAASEVPSPIPVLLKGKYVDSNAGRVRYDIEGIRSVTMPEILAKRGGERPLAAASERQFRSAFVLVSDASAQAADLARLATWARRLGGAEDGGIFLSYCQATGGRATMDTRASRGAP